MMGSLNLVWESSKILTFFYEIQTNYRPFLALFLKKSVLQTKIIYTDRIVITEDACSTILKGDQKKCQTLFTLY